MSDVGFLVEALAQVSEKMRLMPSFRWAVITSRTPVKVRVDGGPGEPEVPVSALFGADSVGDRVLVIGVARRIYAFNPKPLASTSPVLPGFIQEYAGIEAPPGWLLCDGRQVRITDYPELYAVVGRRYGGSGEYFALPNFRGRVSVGVDPMNSAFNQVGKTGGSSTHTLTVEQMPRHRHSHDGYTFLWGSSGNVNIHNAVAMGGASSGNRLFTWQSQDGWRNTHEAGGGKAFSLLQPYLAVTKIIKT